MIVAQWTFAPGSQGLGAVVECLHEAKRGWSRCNGPESAGRVLIAHSGLPRCAVWEFHAPNLAEHDEARERWSAAGEWFNRIQAVTASDIHRVFSVIGHEDESEPFRAQGVVVQALYTPAHGMRQQATDLLREWQREWANVHSPALRGRILGFFSTGLTHELLWQCECASAAEYDRLYRGWSQSAEFDDWARRFRAAVVSNNHVIFKIVSSESQPARDRR